MDSKKPKKPNKKRKRNPLVPKPGIHPRPKVDFLLTPELLEKMKLGVIEMDLREYFETAEGTGILSTADSDRNVDLAIYARPHMVDDETIVLVMSDKLSHTNLQTNPKAAYMFIEKTQGYIGKKAFFAEDP